MAVSLREYRARIRSVESTKKITRAMELIAASRILKAQQRVAAARPYAELLTEAIRNLAAAGGGSGGHPLLAHREAIRTVAFVVVTADRGRAGLHADPVRQEGRGLLPVPPLPHRGRLQGLQRAARLHRRP